MNVPEHVARFLEGPVVLSVGSRDAENKPLLSFVFGATVNPERTQVTFFLPTAESEELLQNLRDSGQISLTAADGVSHEGYQLKGTFIESRPGTPEEAERQEKYVSGLISHLQPHISWAEPLFGGFIHSPFATVTFSVEIVYDQMPGPNAGQEIRDTV